MTPQQINVKLQSMKGNTYSYANKLHKVKSFKISKDDEAFLLITDQTRFKRTFKQADDFFKYWFDSKDNLAKDAIVASVKNSEIVHIEEPDNTEINNQVVVADTGATTSLANELIGILKENIKKVQTSPAYLKQAQMIDKSVGTIINVKRLELTAYNMIKRQEAKNK